MRSSSSKVVVRARNGPHLYIVRKGCLVIAVRLKVRKPGLYRAQRVPYEVAGPDHAAGDEHLVQARMYDVDDVVNVRLRDCDLYELLEGSGRGAADCEEGRTVAVSVVEGWTPSVPTSTGVGNCARGAASVPFLRTVVREEVSETGTAYVKSWSMIYATEERSARANEEHGLSSRWRTKLGLFLPL